MSIYFEREDEKLRVFYLMETVFYIQYLKEQCSSAGQVKCSAKEHC